MGEGVVRPTDEMAEGKNFPEDLENPQVNSGSSQENREEAWAEAKVVEDSENDGRAATHYWGMVMSTGCLLIGAPNIAAPFLLQGWPHALHLWKAFLSLRDWERGK